MPPPDFRGDVAVFAFDVVGFTKDRSQQDMLAVRELTDRVLNAAIEAAGVSSEGKRAWADAGDGGYLALSGDLRQALEVLEQFVKRLDAENERLKAEHQVALRYALHYGSVSIAGQGDDRRVIGNAINDCARLLSGMIPDYVGQVVASAAFREKVEAFGPVGAHFEWLRPIVDKHGNPHDLYNVRKDPGFGIVVPKEDLADPR